jgi:hypothetical protein
LLGDEVWWNLGHRRNSERVLGGHRGDNGHSVDAQSGKRFEVCLQTGAAARIGTGNRESSFDWIICRHGDAFAQ